MKNSSSFDVQKMNNVPDRLKGALLSVFNDFVKVYSDFIDVDQLIEVIHKTDFVMVDPKQDQFIIDNPNIYGYWNAKMPILDMKDFQGFLAIRDDLSHADIYATFAHEFAHLISQRAKSSYDFSKLEWTSYTGFSVNQYDAGGNYIGDFGKGLNEGVTEYTASQIRGENRFYIFETKMAKLLHHSMGDNLIKSFFVEGEEKAAENDFESIMGAGSWNELNGPLDAITEDGYKRPPQQKMPRDELDKKMNTCQDLIIDYFCKKELKKILEGTHQSKEDTDEFIKRVAKLETLIDIYSPKWEEARRLLNQEFIENKLGNNYSEAEKKEHMGALMIAQEDCISAYRNKKEPKDNSQIQLQQIPCLTNKRDSMIVLRNGNEMGIYEVSEPVDNYFYTQIVLNANLNSKNEVDLNDDEKQIKKKINELTGKSRTGPQKIMDFFKKPSNIEIMTSPTLTDYVFVNDKESKKTRVFEINRDNKEIKLSEVSLGQEQSIAQNDRVRSFCSKTSGKNIKNKDNPDQSHPAILPRPPRKGYPDKPSETFQR